MLGPFPLAPRHSPGVRHLIADAVHAGWQVNDGPYTVNFHRGGMIVSVVLTPSGAFAAGYGDDAELRTIHATRRVLTGRT